MSQFDRVSTRIAIIAVWICFLVGGLACFRPFMKQLTTGVRPPAGCDSYHAREQLENAFGVAPVMLTALVRSRTGAPLVNRSVHFKLPFSPFPNPSTPLSPIAANLSHQIRQLGLSIQPTCNVSFVSFWDVSPCGERILHLSRAMRLTTTTALSIGEHPLHPAASEVGCELVVGGECV